MSHPFFDSRGGIAAGTGRRPIRRLRQCRASRRARGRDLEISVLCSSRDSVSVDNQPPPRRPAGQQARAREGRPSARVAQHGGVDSRVGRVALRDGGADERPALVGPDVWPLGDWSLLGLEAFFLSGGQIDGYGNTNVTAIGAPDYPTTLPKVKLGGGGGGCNLAATIGHLTLWTTRHRSGRALVARCDFITDMGHRTPAGSRVELGYSGGGPQWLVTELGVFDYDPEGTARLRQLFPDVSLHEVRAATGFELRVAPDLSPVRPPSPAELAVLRGIDLLGVRRSEFSAAELRRTFSNSSSGRCEC